MQLFFSSIDRLLEIPEKHKPVPSPCPGGVPGSSLGMHGHGPGPRAGRPRACRHAIAVTVLCLCVMTEDSKSCCLMILDDGKVGQRETEDRGPCPCPWFQSFISCGRPVLALPVAVAGEAQDETDGECSVLRLPQAAKGHLVSSRSGYPAALLSWI